MKVYLISSFLLIGIVFSCRTYEAEGELLQRPVEKKLVIPYFNTIEKDYLYKAAVSVSGRELKGILVVKKINKEEKRVALITDFGNTLLDFKISGDSIEPVYIIDDLNRKLIINKLKKYFHFLVNSSYDIAAVRRQGNNLIYTSPFQSGRVFIYEAGGQVIDSLKLAGKRKVKADLTFYSEGGDTADSIRFRSYELPLEMKFRVRE